MDRFLSIFDANSLDESESMRHTVVEQKLQRKMDDMADYTPLELKQTLRIRKLYSLHYFQFAAGYIFPGERHNFWEIVYIDRGEAEIGAGDAVYSLRQGQLLFHQPNEFHTIWANQATGPNIVVISFAAPAGPMKPFCGAHFTLDAPMRRILRQIVSEAQRCFGQVLDISEQRQLVPLDNAPIGSQQLIGLYLEQLLLLLLREAPKPSAPPARAALHLTEEQRAAELTHALSQYMREHLDGRLSFQEICKESGLSQTALKQLFRRYNQMGVMEFYQRIRIEEARRLLREGLLNVSQTAERMGYSSVHQFSRQFKRLMGMSPLGYLRSVRG